MGEFSKDTPKAGETAEGLAAKRRRKFPPLWVWGLTVPYVVTIFVLRTRAGEIDQAVINIISLVLGFFAVMTVGVWFAVLSGYPKALRISATLLALTAVGSLFAIFRIQEVDGVLVPTLRPRWRPDPDELLSVPELAAGSVDLMNATDDDFPQFLGPNRDGVLIGHSIKEGWASGQPELLWIKEIGAGWSGFAVVNGFAVTIEQRGEQELVSCYDATSGELKWINGIDARHSTILGGVGPRSTPTIDNGKVYALGATGVLRCLDGRDGSTIWSDNVLSRYDVTPDQDLSAVAWGRSNSPLIVDNLVVVPFGGPVAGPHKSLAAYEKNTGERIWTAGDRQVSYASPSLETIAGVSQILIVCQDYLSAHHPTSGQVLWEHSWPGNSTSNANCSQPVNIDGNRILLSKAYGTGALMLRVSRDGDQWQTEELWSNSRVLKTKFTNVVVRENFAYALSDGILECVELDAGERQWKGGRFGHGQVLLADDVLIVQAEDGHVHLMEASPVELREFGELTDLEGKTWNIPALYGKLLLIRNGEHAACYRLP